MNHMKPKNSFESFLVMLLMLLFAFGSLLIIFESHEAFKRVTENKNQDEQVRIALSYIEKRVKQSETIETASVEGYDGIRVSDGFGFYTYIFVKDNSLYECYTDESPEVSLSTMITQVNDMKMNIEDQQLKVELIYHYWGKAIHIEQLTSIRGKIYE